MTTPQGTGRRAPSDEDALRRRFLLLAGVLAVLALLHFVDHVVRGELVITRGLDPDWNHSGWPFHPDGDDPYIFTGAFVVVASLLSVGILGTLRGRLWAGYWLATSIFLAALLVFVHFVGFEEGNAETPSIIAMSHDSSVGAVLALIDLFGLFVLLAALAFHSIRARQLSGHW